ncbi:MAG: hypothetical protein HC846_05925 [Blastocatellia bacterium]|nr:hypothetical protein [Blastocatellia bacterium]
MDNLSQTENLDVLLVLALAFENTLAESNPKTVAQIAQKSFAAMPFEDFSALHSRAAFLDKLPREQRELWREFCLEKSFVGENQSAWTKISILFISLMF